MISKILVRKYSEATQHGDDDDRYQFSNFSIYDWMIYDER